MTDIKDPENTLIMEIPHGEVVIEIVPTLRPSM
jgi:peptidylprolyl isomerase